MAEEKYLAKTANDKPAVMPLSEIPSDIDPVSAGMVELGQLAGGPFALIAKNILDSRTPLDFILSERKNALGSIHPECLRNVAELYMSEINQRFGDFCKEYDIDWKLPVHRGQYSSFLSDKSRYLCRVREILDTLRSGKKSGCYTADNVRVENDRFGYYDPPRPRSKLKLIGKGKIEKLEEYKTSLKYLVERSTENFGNARTAMALLGERSAAMNENTSYIDAFACDIGLKGECGALKSEGSSACFGCDYNVFHGDDYPKQGPFSDEEGKILAIARCIQEAKKWGYARFESIKRNSNGARNWVAESATNNGGKKAVISTNVCIASNICDDYGVQVHEADEKSMQACYDAFVREYKGVEGYKKVLKNNPPESFRYSHVGRWDVKDITNDYREFHVTTRCTGPIV